MQDLSKILEFIDETKEEACRAYGWSFALYDSKDEENDYPLIHLKIYWPRKDNRRVIDKVNEGFFWDTDVKYEDLAIFTNNYNAGECHNAICSLMENSYIAEWLLSEGIGSVYTPFDEDFDALKKAGLGLRHRGLYSCIGKIVKKSDERIKMKIKDDGYFIPNKVREVSSKKFHDWYDRQERFKILEDDSDDFWYLKDSVIQTVKRYRSNPNLFLEDYPSLRRILGILEKEFLKRNDQNGQQREGIGVDWIG